MKRFAGVGLVVAGAAAMLSIGTASADPPLRSTSTSVSCEVVVAVGQSNTCTATVADTGTGPATTPTGTVEFSTVTSGTFVNGATCTLAAGSCRFTYPGWDVPGARTIAAAYEGDSTHARSSGSQDIEVIVGPRPPCCFVPRVRGERLTNARATLRRSGFSVGRIDRAFSRRVAKGRVISQKPRRGKIVAPGSRVALVVSKGRRHARP
jgi:PASTA domain-containing protein/Big-like domain-containing protein